MASPKANRADLKAAGEQASRCTNNYSGPRAVAKAFPALARTLQLYDGRLRIGCVVDLEGRREAHGFDHQDRPLGIFASRKIALAAVAARYEHESEAGR